MVKKLIETQPPNQQSPAVEAGVGRTLRPDQKSSTKAIGRPLDRGLGRSTGYWRDSGLSRDRGRLGQRGRSPQIGVKNVKNERNDRIRTNKWKSHVFAELASMTNIGRLRFISRMKLLEIKDHNTSLSGCPTGATYANWPAVMLRLVSNPNRYYGAAVVGKDRTVKHGPKIVVQDEDASTIVGEELVIWLDVHLRFKHDSARDNMERTICKSGKGSQLRIT
nr:hypothetical protein [Tanacetum cinerariifolium]